MAETVTLFHGTTRSAAQRIQEEGWRNIDIRSAVEDVADRYEVERSAIWRDLEKWSRFVTHQGRQGWVSFAATFERASRWAQRAPEAKWEALWAVWRVQHPHAADNWTMNGEGEEWVFREMLPDPPVVMTARVPSSELHEGGFASSTELPLDENKLEWLEAIADIRTRCPAPAEWAVNVEQVPRRVYPPLAADMLGLDFQAFVADAVAGKWGQPEWDPDDPNGKWWPWDSFCRFVTQRQVSD